MLLHLGTTALPALSLTGSMMYDGSRDLRDPICVWPSAYLSVMPDACLSHGPLVGCYYCCASPVPGLAASLRRTGAMAASTLLIAPFPPVVTLHTTPEAPSTLADLYIPPDCTPFRRTRSRAHIRTRSIDRGSHTAARIRNRGCRQERGVHASRTRGTSAVGPVGAPSSVCAFRCAYTRPLLPLPHSGNV